MSDKKHPSQPIEDASTAAKGVQKRDETLKAKKDTPK